MLCSKVNLCKVTKNIHHVTENIRSMNLIVKNAKIFALISLNF